MILALLLDMNVAHTHYTQNTKKETLTIKTYHFSTPSRLWVFVLEFGAQVISTLYVNYRF